MAAFTKRILPHFIFSRAVLLFNWKYFGGWNLTADDVRTMCGRHVDDTRVRLHWRFQLADDICCPHVTRTSSACHPHVVCRHVHHLHIVCRYICHPHIICRTPHGQHGPELSFYSDRNWLLNGICHKNVELFHFRIM